ncbi:MAG: hypothetical protein AAGU27_09120 [Dehalobacterium sp.]
MEMSWFRLAFYGIPENIALVVLAFAIAKAKFDWKRIILMGTLLACIAFVTRLIPITFGVHTLVCLGLLIFLLNYFQKVDLIRSILSVLISAFILILGEYCSRMATLAIFNLTMEEVTNSEFLITVTGIPEVVLLFILALLIKKYIIKDV